MPPGGTGPGMVPQAMAGAGAQAVAAVKMALEALQKALPGLPMGSELHTEVLKAVGGIAKHLEQSQGDAGSVLQQLSAMAKQAQADPQRAAMLRALSPQPGGAPPPAPPMAA